VSISPDQRNQVDPAVLADAVSGAVAAHHGEPGPLLEVLHSLQATLGWIPPAAIPQLANELNLSRAEVHGVVTFYHDFRDTPPAATQVRICRAEACQSVGARELAEHARQRLGIDYGETTPDGSFALDQVFCFGNCALGPAVEVGGMLYGRVDADRLDSRLDGEGS
jgi:formate dehydrogenase subunit gamma